MLSTGGLEESPKYGWCHFSGFGLGKSEESQLKADKQRCLLLFALAMGAL